MSARNDPERAKAFGDLHEGVPAWLKESMLDWIKRRCGDLPQVYLRGDLRDPMQPELRVSLPMRLSQLPTEMYLDVIDYRLRHYRRTRFNVPIHENLEDILKKGGSAWCATERGLERRVEETLQATAESIFEAGDHPASYLRDAWHKAWGRNPDASGPYREAVRAVEAAYAPIVSPKYDRATLGTIIADITNRPSKFQVRLQGDAPDANVERVAGMMRMLWTSQLDRHGTADETVPLNVPLEQAQDAVVLATTLVHLAPQGGFTA